MHLGGRGRGLPKYVLGGLPKYVFRGRGRGLPKYVFGGFHPKYVLGGGGPPKYVFGGLCFWGGLPSWGIFPAGGSALLGVRLPGDPPSWGGSALPGGQTPPPPDRRAEPPPSQGRPLKVEQTDACENSSLCYAGGKNIHDILCNWLCRQIKFFFAIETEFFLVVLWWYLWIIYDNVGVKENIWCDIFRIWPIRTNEY